YQKVASPYRRVLSGTNPSGQLTGPDLVARSTITRALGASQPWSASSDRTCDTAVSASAYGGSANTTLYRPPAGLSWSPAGAGPRASTRSTRSAASTAPGRPIASMFSLITRVARDPCSTSSTWSAPRDRASRPTAPDPAYRSRTRAPASEPSIDMIVENRPSLARSLVGLVSRPSGTASRRPPASPAITRATP